MKILNSLKVACGATLFVAGIAQASVLATFDDLPLPPALNSGTGLQYTNATNSLVYQGLSWDARFSVVGDQYRVDAHGGPLFGIPNSGHYFVTNQDGQSGLLITTDKVLTGAWFGRNQYYGYSEGGADQISIFALSGTTELASVVFDLPEHFTGLAEPLSFVDTSAFGGLSGITAYRIDRREIGSLAGHWVADDFQFRDAFNPVPTPGTLSLLAAGMLYWLLRLRRPTASVTARY